MATDLNQAMLDLASGLGTGRQVTWRQADAMQLPFEDAVFDAVVCQFGVMFFPGKVQAFARDPAVAYCQGTPLRTGIEARDPSGLEQATDVAAQALARRFGTGPVDGKMQAHIVTVER